MVLVAHVDDMAAWADKVDVVTLLEGGYLKHLLGEEAIGEDFPEPDIPSIFTMSPLRMCVLMFTDFVVSPIGSSSKKMSIEWISAMAAFPEFFSFNASNFSIKLSVVFNSLKSRLFDTIALRLEK